VVFFFLIKYLCFPWTFITLQKQINQTIQSVYFDLRINSIVFAKTWNDFDELTASRPQRHLNVNRQFKPPRPCQTSTDNSNLPHSPILLLSLNLLPFLLSFSLSLPTSKSRPNDRLSALSFLCCGLKL
jgi:hypothetical protein